MALRGQLGEVDFLLPYVGPYELKNWDQRVRRRVAKSRQPAPQERLKGGGREQGMVEKGTAQPTARWLGKQMGGGRWELKVETG